MSVKLKSGLTAHEEKFALGLASGLSQRSAYYAAGYTATTDKAADTAACRLAKNVGVANRVNELSARAASQVVDRAVISAQLVYETLARVIQEGLKPIPVAVKGEIAEKCADLPSVVAATKLCAQLLNMLVDRQSVELSGDARQVLERMVQAIATEIPDPAVRERIIARLNGESQPHAPH